MLVPGKSFTLNQLLGVRCDEGFGVGHTRDTQTKGIWFWSVPKDAIVTNQGGAEEHMSVLYFDTEGFESTGKTNAYDDRIFAVSAIISRSGVLEGRFLIRVPEPFLCH